MNILLTNDDGFDSPFLKVLVDAFAKIGAVTVAAPLKEQSWIGKGMSRFRDVSLNEIENFPGKAYAIDGTPGDCVNIALGHLVDTPPDCVVSGINIGHNSGLAFVAASGTVAGAHEGALTGIPSIAASLFLPPEIFATVRSSENFADSEAKRIVAQASAKLVKFAQELVKKSEPAYGIVHNFNFPYVDLDKAEIRQTVAAPTSTKSIFKREGNTFVFDYQFLEEHESDYLTDRQCIIQGGISYTVLDYNQISKK